MNLRLLREDFLPVIRQKLRGWFGEFVGHLDRLARVGDEILFQRGSREIAFQSLA
jgi:hypothetical protein